MWHWDQGHLPYFQFDILRQIAGLVIEGDFKEFDRERLLAATGMSFAAPTGYAPWRNYSRTLKLSLLVSENSGRAIATPIATILSQPGLVTCDEYLHFLVRSFTEPSPALTGWRHDADFRHPLLFALKYLLTKAAITESPVASFNEIIGSYRLSGLNGSEDANQFIAIARSAADYEEAGRTTPSEMHRQARESLHVIAQISYLHVRNNQVIISLNREDAREMFDELFPIGGPCAFSRDEEIRRLAALFADGITDISFNYANTIIDEIVDSGFREGNKVKKTHITIERNASLRREFFMLRPTSTCDVCNLNTSQSYPWTERVIDLHHLLPLCSGTRVEERGTTFDDLVPVCPSCHRAVHRYYDTWLASNGRRDFMNGEESHRAYRQLKSEFPGLILG